MSKLRTGFTTGACAAAAAKAAAMLLAGQEIGDLVEIRMPDESRVEFGLVNARITETGAECAVRKDAGDDPDVTDGALIVATVEWMETGDIAFVGGEGVGTVTKPGLTVPPGEPAINPAPRRMISDVVREVTDRPVRVTISIPGGKELAEKTFNPRLGVVGGLSILGTTGVVRPFSSSALRDALKCSLDVASAAGVTLPVLVPGHIGERAARRHFRLTPEQVVEVSNEWSFMLDCAAGYSFERLLVMGHPGKLAKFISGDWDTHSSRSSSAVPVVLEMCRRLGLEVEEQTTVEGVFAALSPEQRETLGSQVAKGIRLAVVERFAVVSGKGFPETPPHISVTLVNMAGDIIGVNGDLSPWK